MSHITCLIQSAGRAAGREGELERRLRAHHAEHFASGEVAVSWPTVDPGRRFTAGAPSITSVVARTVDESTVSVGTTDVEASFTMEGGRLLPEPGSPEEGAWKASDEQGSAG